MEINVTENEYLDAVTEACRIVDQCTALPADEPMSSQDREIKRFVAAIYDTVIPCPVLGTLMVSNATRRNLLLILLIGRCKFGRPSHDRAEDMLAWGYECMKDN